MMGARVRIPLQRAKGALLRLVGELLSGSFSPSTDTDEATALIGARDGDLRSGLSGLDLPLSETVHIASHLQRVEAEGMVVLFHASAVLVHVTRVKQAATDFYVMLRKPNYHDSMTPKDRARVARSRTELCATAVFGAPADVIAGFDLLRKGWPRWIPPVRVVAKPRKSHLYTLYPMKNGIGVRSIKIPPLGKVASLGNLYNTMDGMVRERIQANTKGLILLHGPPGTGKTTYISRLIHTCDELGKRIILVPRSLITLLSGPQLVSLLPILAKTPSVLLVEDAEPLLEMERTEGTSVLLNLTDGLLNDVAQTQVVATFNCPIDSIDPALLRDGRLLVRWEFGLLSVEDARAAAVELDLDPSIVTQPMTIAQLAATKPLIMGGKARARVGM